MKRENPVLKRLGPIPFWRGSEKCLASLDRIYRKAQEAAQKTLEEGGVKIFENTPLRTH